MHRRTKALIATGVTVAVLAALGAGAHVLIDSTNASFHIAASPPAAEGRRFAAAVTGTEREAALEQWLRSDVAAAAGALDADPESGISAVDVRAQMAAKRSTGR
ncbi:hypothetical protein [Leifsonia sp. TF02-11]|uniref:hypothetical protein n=1 Tax=Leifsonia sp. TF02-11 TaxID=2815212 RepID=UPI001AA0CAAF|nr:hypothetical protein [Leifsonia sp. TF02-11]MBO1737208.1 hypothetical protein [Leifsonia sp. TF02-11]